jgi:hypothetical protein
VPLTHRMRRARALALQRARALCAAALASWAASGGKMQHPQARHGADEAFPFLKAVSRLETLSEYEHWWTPEDFEAPTVERGPSPVLQPAARDRKLSGA